ncbi:MAG: hypothetical protein QOG57_5948, partial [Pseudonocardiales bacterium]|nr:hypothetical protein [Pseudonocardiales bacterium]
MAGKPNGALGPAGAGALATGVAAVQRAPAQRLRRASSSATRFAVCRRASSSARLTGYARGEQLGRG